MNEQTAPLTSHPEATPNGAAPRATTALVAPTNTKVVEIAADTPTAGGVVAPQHPDTAVNAPETPAKTHSLSLLKCGLAFMVTTAFIWIGYFAWRPPLPMLYLRHIEHMGNSSKVSLTFDDAPHPLSTPLLLAALKRSDVKGSFFVVGEGLRIYPELGYRIVSEGHALANHSENHRNLTRIPVEDYDLEVGGCFDRIEALGQKTRLFRPPGGGLNRDAMQFLYAHNVTLAWWSNNIGDWVRPPAWKIVDHVNRGTHPGDIILLHDAGIGTAQALPRIVRNARDEGRELVVMPEK